MSKLKASNASILQIKKVANHKIRVIADGEEKYIPAGKDISSIRSVTADSSGLSKRPTTTSTQDKTN
jgi:hypothetical protein